MKNDKVFGVLLTEQAWRELGDALAQYASKGRIGNYMYCKEVSLNGPYFVMVTTTSNDDGSEFEAEISIPHHYVKLFVSASEKSKIGFVQE